MDKQPKKISISYKSATGENTYYAINAEVEWTNNKGEIKDGEIEATLVCMWDDNCAVPEYSLTVINDPIGLTDEEIEELKQLAIDAK